VDFEVVGNQNEIGTLEILESKVEGHKNVQVSWVLFRIIRNGAVVTVVEMATTQDNSCEGREPHL
jgi:hypothetical protein